MTLYGYSREPDPAARDETDIGVPDQRVSSEPVPVPADGLPAEPAPEATNAPSLWPEPATELAQWNEPAAGPGGSAWSEPAASPGGSAWNEPAEPPAPWQDLLTQRSEGTDEPMATVHDEDLRRAAAAATSPAPIPTSASSPADATAAALAAWSADVRLDDLSELEDDEPFIVPWDRRPLMVVIAAAAALVLLAVVSGIAASSMVGGPGQSAAWMTPGQVEPTAAPTTSAAAAPPAGDTVTLSGVGDVIMGTMPGDLPPQGGAGFFDAVKDALAADVVMGNLETPLTDNTGAAKCPPNSTDCFQFYLPPSYANHLKAGGFQVLSLANNHTNDMGAKGLTNTKAALDAAGIAHTGAVNQITYVDVKGVKVAVLGFAIYSWGQSLNNIPAAEALVRKADETADLVVIQMQGGAEGSDKSHVRPGHELFLGEDRGDLMKFSRAVIDAGADVVFGHGPHIMRGMEFYKGRLIAYSLGNFCGYGVLNSAGFLGVGGVLKVTLSKDGSWVRGQLVPTEMVKGGLPAPDAEKRALAFVNGLSQADFGAAAAQIATTDGSITGPVTP